MHVIDHLSCYIRGSFCRGLFVLTCSPKIVAPAGSTRDLEQHLGHPVLVASNADVKLSAAAVTLVFFVGGVTCAELTALRALFQKRNTPLIIGTTALMNGNNLVESMTFL